MFYIKLKLSFQVIDHVNDTGGVTSTAAPELLDDFNALVHRFDGLLKLFNFQINCTGMVRLSKKSTYG